MNSTLMLDFVVKSYIKCVQKGGNFFRTVIRCEIILMPNLLRLNVINIKCYFQVKFL